MNTKLNQLNNELNSLKSGSNERNKDIMQKEEEVETLQNNLLIMELEKFQSWNLLNDEKPSSTFLKLEKRKQGYSSINKINSPNPIYIPTEQGGSEDPKVNPPKNSSHKPKPIRTVMKYFMEDIY